MTSLYFFSLFGDNEMIIFQLQFHTYYKIDYTLRVYSVVFSKSWIIQNLVNYEFDETYEKNNV